MEAQATLTFAKMHGLGNDFMVVDLVSQSLELLGQASFAGLFSAERIRAWANRHTGIGFDQLLIVEPPSQAANDFRYRIFNADGGEVEQCGNGARCFARFVVEQGLFFGESIKVETAAGIIVLQLSSYNSVRVDMGPPKISPQAIPFLPASKASEKGSWFLPLDKSTFDNQPHLAKQSDSKNTYIELYCVSMGNPHAVVTVESVDNAPVAEWGPWLESHAAFPERANIGFMEVVSKSEIRLRVFERGTGETLACGTGACAAVVAGVNMGLLNDTVQVRLRGGDLKIEYHGGEATVIMSGPAQQVFTGNVNVACS